MLHRNRWQLVHTIAWLTTLTLIQSTILLQKKVTVDLQPHIHPGVKGNVLTSRTLFGVALTQTYYFSGPNRVVVDVTEAGLFLVDIDEVTGTFNQCHDVVDECDHLHRENSRPDPTYTVEVS
ncbi:hypothetical protein ACJMK2_024097 [Sinanodonta woodiana]|uniref:Uncharacterized protein n=1 Tax=Sinanodonta woodiana TaxID=1069815 RepID=A0ABD3T761_SINWO